MEKSLALALPDHPGSVREVMRIFSQNGVSVLRMSYSHMVDAHALFVDIWGSTAAIAQVEEELRAWRFFPGQREVGSVHLLEFTADDSITLLEPVLTYIERNELNVTYIDARTDGMHKTLQVAVYAKDRSKLDSLLSDIGTTFDVRIVPPSPHRQLLDNNHSMLLFARKLTTMLDLTKDDEQEILINSNRIMQNLARSEADPFHPFVSIYLIAEALATYRGESFIEACRITRLTTAKGLPVTCIEPPVGSNTWVFECDDRLLCVDAGYCLTTAELERVLRDLYPHWDQTRKELVLTHGDIDHVGACDAFDHVYASGRTIDGFTFESMGVVTWREQSPRSLPYIRIGSVLSSYRIPDLSRMVCLGEPSPLGEQQELLERIDTLEIAPLTFEVWEGKGGHVRGETVLIERDHRVCVSGDIFVNVHGETKPQARFNQLAPYLMTSVDSVPDLARQERTAMFGLLGEGTWQVMGGHGAVYEWQGR